MRRARPEPKAPKAPFCGRCDNGWLTRPDTDPLYEGRPLAYPCPCNESGQQDLAQYREELWRSSWYPAGMKAERERRQASIAKGLSENPNADDLKRENVKSAFYTPPSRRGDYLDRVSAKKELAARLHGSEVSSWGLAEWEAFDGLHPDARKELESHRPIISPSSA